MTIVIHHLENSRSQRVIWLLEELGLPYLVKRYERDPKTGMAPPALKEIHRLGKSPIIQDGDVTVAETGAIIDYLVAIADGKLGEPADRESAARYTHFMHYAEGSLMPPLFALLVLGRMGETGKAAAATVRQALGDHLDWLDKEIATRPWFAGEGFTAADVMMSFPLEAARQRGGLDESYLHLNDYLDRIHARPTYRIALERGGPYAFA